MAVPRALTVDDVITSRPTHAVWEITLACDLKCNHCGSRAGSARKKELSTAECFDVVEQLARLGTREITLIGGEAYLRPDWVEIIGAIRQNGMNCAMTTGGRNLSEERVAAAAKAGLSAVSVSVDGLEPTHDRIRGVKGSFQAALAAIGRVTAHGMAASSNTQISRLSMHELPALMEHVIGAGAKQWQLQLTVAMGNAVDHPELLLQPYELLEIMPILAALHQSGAARGFSVQPGNNIGYFGPYESLWRDRGEGIGHWTGCRAGQNSMGLEADGTIKGCPSLPTLDYTGGNVRDKSIAEIWEKAPEIRFTRDRTIEDLWGFCRTCYYADVCRGGCSWTSHALFGKPGNNPFCHYRALQLAKEGKRERVVKIEDAPGLPFATGKFALVVQALDAPINEPMPKIPEPRIRHSLPRVQ